MISLTRGNPGICICRRIKFKNNFEPSRIICVLHNRKNLILAQYFCCVRKFVSRNVNDTIYDSHFFNSIVFDTIRFSIWYSYCDAHNIRFFFFIIVSYCNKSRHKLDFSYYFVFVSVLGK